jgi:hypothetical protein
MQGLRSRIEMKCPITITPAHLVYDRSRTTTDWDCPRKRYWGYEYSGSGIRPEADAVELFTGTVTHTGLSSIALGNGDIDTIATTAYKAIFAYHAPDGFDSPEEVLTHAYEQATLVEGLLRGFAKHVWPKLMTTYEVVTCEEEMFYIHDQHGEGTLDGHFVMMVKPDLVLRHRESRKLYYYEYKTTGTKKENWVNAWDDAIQVHSTMAAIEQSLGEPVEACIVQGLYKGYESYGKLSSPFVYAYYKKGDPPFTKPEFAHEYKPGFRRSPTWEMEGGIKKWIETMPGNVLAEQFPQTPPIFVKADILINYFQQRAMRELEIMMAKQMLAAGVAESLVLNGTFPQRFDRCKPPYGNAKPCQFRLLCHGCVSNPLNAGFETRQPHHELEIEVQTTNAQNETTPQQPRPDQNETRQAQEGSSEDGEENPATP